MFRCYFLLPFFHRTIKPEYIKIVVGTRNYCCLCERTNSVVLESSLITRRSIHIGGQTQGYSNPRRSLPSKSAALLANVGNHQPKTRTKRSFEVGRDEVERVLSQGAGADAFQQRRLQEHTDTPIGLFCLRGTGGCVVNVTRSYRHPVGDVGLLQTTLI